VLQDLADSEIGFSLDWSPASDTWAVKLGDALNGYDAQSTAKTEAAALQWLDAMAREIYPDSAFAAERELAEQLPGWGYMRMLKPNGDVWILLEAEDNSEEPLSVELPPSTGDAEAIRTAIKMVLQRRRDQAVASGQVVPLRP
jgi:hypothetical protein